MPAMDFMTFQKRGRRGTPRLILGIHVILTILDCVYGTVVGRYGYFSKENSSSVLLPNTEWHVGSGSQLTEFSFRTCEHGVLLYQTGAGGDSLNLTLNNTGGLEFHWSIGTVQSNIFLGSNLNNNEWWTVTSQRYLGNLVLKVSKGGRVKYNEIISNSNIRNYFTSIDLSGSQGLQIGLGFSGCILEGPNVVFVGSPGIVTNNVEWSNTSCVQTNASCPNSFCFPNPNAILEHKFKSHCERASNLQDADLDEYVRKCCTFSCN